MKIEKRLLWAIIVSVMGSLIFGINMAAISGAVTFVKDHFLLSEFQIGLVVSAIVIGCMIGAFSAGSISEKIGRKNVLIGTAVLFSISAVWSALASSMGGLVAARIIGGVGVGAVSVMVPTYISEIAPARVRGTLGTFNQLGIVIGILLAYVFDYSMLDVEHGWRWMLASPLFIAVPFLIAMQVKFPESPRWLVLKGFKDEALHVLTRVAGPQNARKEYDSIVKGIEEDRKKSDKDVKFSHLFKGKVGKVVFLGIMLAAFQQITGINAIIAYAPTIFNETGVGGDMALLQSVMVGIVNFLFTLVAVWLIDKLGRKKLLLIGTAGMTVSLGYLVFAFLTGRADSLGVLISILGYIAFFAASLAPVMWVVTSEIYPNKIRGVAMSVSTAVSWVCTFIVVQFFPWMLNSLGGAVAFGFFLFFTVWAFFYILAKIPETKGKSLEEIEEELGLRGDLEEELNIKTINS
ncbi:MFS transporter [Marinilabilia rubra]|uniref:MFS transporter n=2 Tax=Marinilabilia rubra TaxID=2162893 RepID=A0A2U2B9S6_9BACT|nr:MFS transporter [Marinilabilia rubra]